MDSWILPQVLAKPDRPGGKTNILDNKYVKKDKPTLFEYCTYAAWANTW